MVAQLATATPCKTSRALPTRPHTRGHTPPSNTAWSSSEIAPRRRCRRARRIAVGEPRVEVRAGRQTLPAGSRAGGGTVRRRPPCGGATQQAPNST